MTALPAHATPQISSQQVLGAPFSPNGDGSRDDVTLSFLIGADEDSVTVRVEAVRVADAAVMAVLADDVRVPTAPYSVDWAPTSLVDGEYRFDVTVSETVESVSVSLSFFADTTFPTPALTILGPNPFDPILADSVLVNFSALVTTTTDNLVVSPTTTVVTVERFGGAVFATLASIGGAPTDSAVSWNGSPTGAAQPVAGGVYDLVVTATDLAGNSASVSQALTVDNEAPQFQPGAVDTFETDTFPVEIRGTVIDDALIESVELSVDGGKTFVPADTVSAVADSVDYVFLFTDPSPMPSFTDLILRANDPFGHDGDTTIVIAYDQEFPVLESAEVLSGSFVNNGDDVTIRTEWNLDGLELLADFGDLDQNFNDSTHTANTVELGNGVYETSYGVTRDNSKLPGLKDIFLDARTPFLSARASVQVRLQARFQGADEAVSIDRNSFDPRMGDEVTIAARFGTIDVAVHVIDLSGRQVAFVEGDGFAVWDGRNSAGKIVASGIYLLRIKLEGDEETMRKVAVIPGGGS